MADIRLRCDGCGMTEASLPGGYRPINKEANHLRVDDQNVWCKGTWRVVSVSVEPPPSAEQTSTFERLKAKLAEPGRNGVIRLEPAAAPPAAAEDFNKIFAQLEKSQREVLMLREERGRLEHQLAEALNERDMANREAAALNQQRIRLEDRLRRAEAGRR